MTSPMENLNEIYKEKRKKGHGIVAEDLTNLYLIAEMRRREDLILTIINKMVDKAYYVGSEFEVDIDTMDSQTIEYIIKYFKRKNFKVEKVFNRLLNGETRMSVKISWENKK